jgi:hypothetical protein
MRNLDSQASKMNLFVSLCVCIWIQGVASSIVLVANSSPDLIDFCLSVLDLVLRMCRSPADSSLFGKGIKEVELGL